eukprot:gene4448-12757_t
MADSQAKFHSKCRWNKPVAEVKKFALANKGVINEVDPKNGNYPIHITAQNGHRELTQLLIDLKADPNAQNGTGTTALHMANAYDYYWVGQMLVAGGANPELKNDQGNTAASGIEGDKPETGDFIAAMTNAINEDELNTAFTNLEVEAKDQKIDKGKFVFEGMKKKKECKNPEEAAHGLWTTEANAKFTSIVQSL